MPKRFSTFSVAVVSLIFTYLFFGEYLSPFRKVLIPFDLWGFHYTLADYAFQSLRHFSFPAWDVSIYSGQPFAANIQAALFYPPIWIMYALSAWHGVLKYSALEAFQFAHIWLGFVLFFCWLRNKGLTDLACILGAGIFAYSGYTMLQLQHLGLLCGYVWLPLGLWGIDDLAKDRYWPGFLKVVAASAASFLAGYPPIWLVLAIYWGSYSLFSGKVSVVVRTLLALLASLALAAVQLLPAIEVSSLMMKENKYGGGVRDLAFYISYLIPNFYDFGINVPVMTSYGKEYLYLGAPAFFGIVALVIYQRWRPVVPVLAAGSVCLVFLTNPFDIVWASIRNSQVLAQACRDWYFLGAITAAVAALAAFGIDGFLSSSKKVSKTWVILSMGCAAARMIYEARGWRLHGAGFPSGWWSGLDAVATLLVFAICIFAVRGQSGLWRTAMTVILLLSAGMDYKAFGTSKRFNGTLNPLPHNYAREGFTATDPDAFQALMAHRESRVLVDLGAFFPAELRHHGLATPQGFDPFFTEQYRDMLAALGARFLNHLEFSFDPRNDLALQALAVRYVITIPNGPFYPIVNADPNFKLLGKDDSYFHIYEYQKYAEPFGWAQPNSGAITPLARTPENRQFRITSRPAPSDFVLKEQFFPGWTAYLDGRTIPIQRWRGAFQSVHVPAGDHSLDFRYQPRALKIGAWISAITALLLLAISWRTASGRYRSQ